MCVFGFGEKIFKLLVDSDSVLFNSWELRNREDIQARLLLLTSEINSRTQFPGPPMQDIFVAHLETSDGVIYLLELSVTISHVKCWDPI